MYRSSQLIDKGSDRRLIELIRAQPALYEPAHHKYMDTEHKGELWRDIAHHLAIDVSSCKARWNNIRDNYRKSLKKNRGKECERVVPYKYAEQLRFIRKYFKPDAELDELQPEEGDEAEGVEGAEGLGDRLGDGLHADQPPAKRPRPPAPDDYWGARAGAGATPHPMDAFLAGVAPALKALSRYEQALAKAEIFGVVHKYELRALTALGELGALGALGALDDTERDPLHAPHTPHTPHTAPGTPCSKEFQRELGIVDDDART